MDDVRLIDANALQRAFDKAHEGKPDFFCDNFLNNAGNPSTEWDCVDDILANAPTIEAHPVKHGKWVETEPDEDDSFRTIIKPLSYRRDGEEVNMRADYHEYGGIVTNAAVYGINEAVMASKYPMATDTRECSATLTETAKQLGQCAMGTGHDNWLSGIVVQFDLTCTIKMWTEFERYHFAQIVSSQSTMHRLERFDIDTQCIEHVDKRVLDAFKAIKAEYEAEPSSENRLKMLYSCPVGLKLTARITTNYRQLKTMFAQRQNHRLPEWRLLCYWMTLLPYSELITGGTDND